MQRWAAALAAALFAPQPSVEDSSQPTMLPGAAGAEACRERLWQLLGELAPLGDAVDAVLRASRQPLLEQLPRTPAEWQPAVIGSHAVAGALALHSDQAVACSSVMYAVHDVHTLTLEVSPAGGQRNGRNARGKRRALCAAVATLPALRTLDLDLNGIAGGGADEAALVDTLAHLPQLACLTVQGAYLRCNVLDRRCLAALTALTSLNIIADYCASELSALSGLPRLRTLHIVGIGDFGGRLLAPPLRALTTLTVLRLRGSQCVRVADPLNSCGVATLTPALAGLSQLVSLELSAWRLGSSSAYALTAALGSIAPLSRLTLGCRDGTGDGGPAIASSLTRLSQLAHLSLRHPVIRGKPHGGRRPQFGVWRGQFGVPNLGSRPQIGIGTSYATRYLQRVARAVPPSVHRAHTAPPP